MALIDEQATICANGQVGPNLHLMTVKAPALAQAMQPGQFVHMRIPGMDDHILRRPFSIYATDAQQGTLDILYQVVGHGSRHMATLVPGQCGPAQLIGPVGSTWQPAGTPQRALLVGGGVGAAPLFMLCQQLAGKGCQVDVVLGAQTGDALVCRERYHALVGDGLSCATDDGSFGRAGFCTSLVEEALAANQYGYVAVCGPEPLMKIVSKLALDAGVPCQVSLEKRMACGVGACLSCVVDTVEGKKRACVDGPVFDAAKVVW